MMLLLTTARQYPSNNNRRPARIAILRLELDGRQSRTCISLARTVVAH